MFFIRTLALLAITIVGLVSAESKTRYSLKKDFNNSYVSGDLHDSLISYIACDRSLGKSKTGSSVIKCNVTHGTVDEKGEQKSCDLEFTETMDTNHLTIHALSTDKSLIVWADEDLEKPHYLLKFTVVHFPSCDTYEAKIDFENHKSLRYSVIRYNNAFIPGKEGTFDVFFENLKYCLDKVCRLTLNAQAETIKGPTAAYTPVKQLFDASIELNTVDNSFVVYEGRTDDTRRMSLITPDENFNFSGQKILKEAGAEGTDNSEVSTLQGKIRVCKQIGDTKFACELFNSKGESISKDNVEIEHKFDSYLLFNLPNGEYVFETESQNQAVATKIGADGKRIGTIDRSGYICKKGETLTAKDVYAENSRLCITRMCTSDTNVDVVQQCYDNADIK